MTSTSLGLLIAGLVVLAVALPLGRPQQPVTDPIEQARRDSAGRVEEQRAHDEWRADQADDLRDGDV